MSCCAFSSVVSLIRFQVRSITLPEMVFIYLAESAFGALTHKVTRVNTKKSWEVSFASRAPGFLEILQHSRIVFEESGQIRQNLHRVLAEVMLDPFDVSLLRFGVQPE